MTLVCKLAKPSFNLQTEYYPEIDKYSGEPASGPSTGTSTKGLYSRTPKNILPFVTNSLPAIKRTQDFVFCSCFSHLDLSDFSKDPYWEKTTKRQQITHWLLARYKTQLTIEILAFSSSQGCRNLLTNPALRSRRHCFHRALLSAWIKHHLWLPFQH